MRAARFVCIIWILASVVAWAQSNPVPLVNQPLVPASTAPGGAGFTLTVNGTGFVSGATVNWNGTALTTTLVSNSQLTAAVPSPNIATARTASVTVTNPAPGGGESNTVFFSIAATESNLVLASSVVGTGQADPTALLQGDVNGDEIPDLVSLDQSGSLRVVLGNGDGTFGAPISLASVIGSQSRLDLTGDFNNDGIEDFIVSDTGSVQVQTFLGNGDGTFTPTVTSFSAQGLTLLLGVVAGDFNGDGKLDLACECQNGGDPAAMGVMLGNGDGTFQPPIESLTQTSNEAIPAVAADFNDDAQGALSPRPSAPGVKPAAPDPRR